MNRLRSLPGARYRGTRASRWIAGLRRWIRRGCRRAAGLNEGFVIKD